MEEFGSETAPLRPSHEEIEEGDFLEVNAANSIQKGWSWWFVVALNSAFLLFGQVIGAMLGKFYFEYGGKSKWMATLVQTAGFPVLYIPVLFLRRPRNVDLNCPTSAQEAHIIVVCLVYIFLGVLLAADDLLYSLGLWYLPVSTYTLLCATQLAFNALFSFFINSQKLTFFILNSVFLLSISAMLIALSNSSSDSKGVSNLRGTYLTGFICTILASAIFALYFSLTQLSFNKILRKETFSVVLDMQIYTSLVATCICAVGLFASGEASELKEDMDGFQKGKVLYVLGLVGTALAWQAASVGALGLIFLVSSLFSNVISMVTLPLVPIIAVIVYGEEMDGWIVVAMILAVWGCSSYFYQNYLDEKLASDQTPSQP
ncbi:hypothetical protein MLD38_000377 [Melastoma candidum]|uniref:Uncharacterized protein n=1 Tax=Melastoma candidum TaxID=119954 RepID=A0ACB9SAB4_9MYRT|nr:hypothetical protein MLD38_000377 [Melastoma candidum]